MSASKQDRSAVRPQSGKKTRVVRRLATVPVLIITGCFTLLGVTKLVPALGLFGLIWTLGAGGMFAFGLYNLNRRGEESVQEERTVDMEDGTTVILNDSEPAAAGSIQRRLLELDSLLHSGLVTMEEYEAKRKSILDEL